MSEPTRPEGRRLISFVLPVFNEKPSLRPLCEGIGRVMQRSGEDYELVFIDDGSTDGSFETLRELHRSDPRVRVVRFRRNFGKADAYNAGFEAARGDYVITMDTDLQDDPEEIPLFIEKLDEGYDLVTGWKHEGKGSLGKSMPSRIFNQVVRRLTHIPLHDFNCPFKAYRREVLSEIHIYGELHRYIPVLAAARGFTMAEVKISNLPRQHGKTHYGIERYLRGMLDLMTVIFLTRFSRRPMHLLAIGGLAAVGLGSGILGVLFIGHVMFRLGVTQNVGWNIHDRPAISTGILLIIVGIQFLVSGLLAELFVKRWSGHGGDPGYSIGQTLDGDPHDAPDGDTVEFPTGGRRAGGHDG